MQELQQRPTPLPAAVNTRIDVLIPVFNGAATVASAIDSIREQTVGDLRIVVVDDGSSDETPRILAAMAAADPRIVVVAAAHGGIVDALNAGLKHCSADFIARHDADDIAYPHRFEEQLAYLQAHPECVAVASFAWVVDQDGRPDGALATTLPGESDPTFIPCKEPYLLHPFMMVRRSALLAIGGYRHVYHAEDADLCWRLQEIGGLHAIPRPLGEYRIHAGSVTGRSTLNGRVSAIYSQLAAISAVRRRSHVSDLQFPPSTLELMHAAVTPEGMFDIARRELSPTESAYLKPAFAAKFLQLACYRSYDIELEDCHFIRAALFSVESQLPAGNRRSIRRSRAVLAARLLTRGRLRAALVILSLDTLHETVMRFGVHVIARCMPEKLRIAIWDWKSRRTLTRMN